MKIQKIMLSRIDVTSDGWDNFIFDLNPPHVDRMAQSLQKVGQLYPLLLLKDMEWLFLISGWARYLAMKKLDVKEAWARIFQLNEISKEEALWLAVEVYSGGSFNPAAQRRIFERFRDIAKYSEERIAKEVAPAIGLEASVDLVRKILTGGPK
jgi:ParB-like chromosome segregation protein Spo0J